MVKLAKTTMVASCLHHEDIFTERRIYDINPLAFFVVVVQHCVSTCKFKNLVIVAFFIRAKIT